MAKYEEPLITNDGPSAPPPTTNASPNWTVMLFMVAERMPEWEDLSAQALRTIQDLREASLSEHVKVFVQLHMTGQPQVERLFIRNGEMESTPVSADRADMNPTNGVALTGFLSWALHGEEWEHQPGDHSMLVMWGHANRFGLGHRDTGTGIDALDFEELSKVLDDFQAQQVRYYKGAPSKLDILGFDACDLATIEVADKVSQYARHLIASQIAIPAPGWPYKRILEQLVTSYDEGRKPMSPANLGAYIVRRFCSSYHGKDQPASLSFLDLSRSGKVTEMTEELAQRILLALDGDSAEADWVQDLFGRAQTFNGHPFVDAADLCANLVRQCNDSEVRLAASKLGNLLTTPLPVDSESHPMNGDPFVLENGRNAHDTVKLHGVSLYAPNIAVEVHDWLEAASRYERLGCLSWTALVHALAQRS